MKRILYILILPFLFTSIGFSQNPALPFLKSLDKDQRAKTQLQFDDPLREAWHFFPASMVPREGIALSELNVTQKELLHNMLQYHLSQSGYDKAKKIMALEDVLLEMEGNSTMRDAEKYYTTIYGDPRKANIWGWSFEGHHLSLNFAISGDKVSFAPRFMGASPALIKQGKRKGERTLVNEEDYALELINVLTPDQQEKAIFVQSAPNEIITFVETAIQPMEPVGIPMSQLDTDQRKLLLRLIHEYLSVMPPDLAKKRMDNLGIEHPETVYFGWAGAKVLGKPHYYRIQGKTFLIEFDNTQNNANHIHSVWRDFDGDFGRDLIREHYKNSNHH